jgi:hypothetical protein
MPYRSLLLQEHWYNVGLPITMSAVGCWVKLWVSAISVCTLYCCDKQPSSNFKASE